MLVRWRGGLSKGKAIMEIKNKVVLVTGASGGIGKATAELFVRKGAKVVLTARSREEVRELTAKIPDSLAVAVDMTKPLEIQQMVLQTHAYYGRIDVLVNNAGQESNPSLEHIDVEDFARLMTSDVYGPLVVMQTTIPLMKLQGGGAIVNISSGVLQTTQSATPQTASATSILSKSSLNTRTEYSDQGISVSLVYPRGSEVGTQKFSNQNNETHKKHKTEVHKPDSPETIAAKIVDTIEKGIAVEFL
jgi:NADP-dependent 3-hydroxy acid dehydrogenase YdfG